MKNSALAAGVRRLRGLMALQGRHEESDEQLLHAFTAQHDDSAFAALVRRYGPLVMGVCRRVLHHAQDAEDAFQAAFLLLARNAAKLRNKTALASWLHGAAYRVALTAKRAAARRRKHEAAVPREAGERGVKPSLDPVEELSWRETQTLLDEEIARLPEIYRSVFVLCCLEDLSREEAARRLGLKEGTLSSRLTAARKRLARRLSRRGMELTAVLAASALATQSAPALSMALMVKTVETTLAMAAGEELAGIVSVSVAELVQEATAAMMSKAKIVTVVVLAVSLLTVATSGSLVSWHGRASGPLAATPADQPRPRTHVPQHRESVEVSGRVVDPDGKPVAGAKVVFHQQLPQQELPDFFPTPSTGTTDAEGRFHFSAKVHRNAPTRGDRPPIVTLTAHISGYGPAVVETQSPDELKDRTLRLVKDDVPLRGRILNLEGRPIAGVTVCPVAIFTNAANDLGRWLKAIDTSTWEELPHDLRMNISFSTAIAGLTQTALTDREGKFTLSGFGRERIVVLRLDGPDIETCFVKAMTRPGPTVRVTPKPMRVGGGLPRPPGKSLNHPPRTDHNYAHGVPFDFAPGLGLTVEGTVRDRDTGKPLAGIVVSHHLDYNYNTVRDNLRTTTDADGNYRLAGLSRTHSGAFHSLQFIPPRGQPYFPAYFSPAAPAFGKPAKLDVQLKRGVLVKGRVTDKATGQPIQAVVGYFVFRDNPNFRALKGFAGSSVVSSKKDGSFTLAVLAGQGILTARTDDMRRGTYLYGQGEDAIRGIKDKRIDAFVTSPYMLHAWQFDTLIEIQPDEKAESLTCDLQLDPGKTVKGTILDPEGKPLAGVSIRSAFDFFISIRDLPSASFTIPAVNPRKSEVYFFEHPKKNLAAAVILKGDEPEGFTVKLKPAATITGRIVTEKGEPIDKYYIRVRVEAGQLNMKRPSYSLLGGRSGADGRFKIDGLLAGVKLGEWNGLFANLTLQPGEIRDLGDIKIQPVR